MSAASPPSPARRPAAGFALLLTALGTGCDPGPTDPSPPPPGTVVPALGAIAFGDGVFVGVGRTFVVGEGGSIVHASDSVLVVRSTDGATWTAVGPSLRGVLTDVTYGAGRWVAVGGAMDDPTDESVVLASDDGVAWERVEVQGGRRWRSVAYGNGGFVVTAFDPATATSVVTVSDDGLTWTATAETGLFDAEVSFGGGRFVLWGESGGVGLSTDGVDWEVRGVPFVNRITALVHAGGGWVGSGVFDCCFGEMPEAVEYYDLGSGDGDSWQSEERELREFIFDLDILNGVFTAATGERLLVSDIEGAWRSVEELGEEERVFHLACSSITCVAAGRALATTMDLEVWEVREIPY